MVLFTDGLDAVAVSTTETSVNIPKDAVAVQITNRDTTNRAIISLGKTGRTSLIVSPMGVKSIDLTEYIQLRALQGRPWDWGNDGFGGLLTHRTAASTATIDIEYIVAAGV